MFIRINDFIIDKQNICNFSELIRNTLSDINTDTLTFDNINETTLQKIVDYINFHQYSTDNNTFKSFDEYCNWDREFITSLNRKELYDLYIASDYLLIDCLSDLCNRYIAYKAIEFDKSTELNKNSDEYLNYLKYLIYY